MLKPLLFYSLFAPLSYPPQRLREGSTTQMPRAWTLIGVVARFLAPLDFYFLFLKNATFVYSRFKKN
jgi:hypothetical protein